MKHPILSFDEYFLKVFMHRFKKTGNFHFNFFIKHDSMKSKNPKTVISKKRDYRTHTIATLFFLLFLMNCLNAQVLDSQIYNAIVNKSRLPFEFGSDETLDMKTLQAVRIVIQNTDYHVRWSGYSNAMEVGLKTASLVAKKETCRIMLQSATDPTFAIREGFHEWLRQFEKSVFDESLKNEISKLLHDEKLVNRGILLLAGYLDMREEIGFMKEHYAVSSKRYPNEFTINSPFRTVRFAAWLALARMGDEESTNNIISCLDTLRDEDIVLFGLEYIAYMRNNKAAEILLKYLNSEGKTSGSPPCVYRERYAWRALYQLARTVKDFPITKGNSPFYSEEDVETARNWMRDNRLNIQWDDNHW